MLNQVPRKEKTYTEKGVRVRLIAAVILAAVSFLVLGWVMSKPLTQTGGGSVMAILLFAALIGIAVVMFVGYQKGRRRVPNFKTGKPLIFAAIAITALGFFGAIAIPGIPAMVQTARNNELNNALQKYVNKDWSKKTELPENPKFVMYNTEKNKFYYPENVGLNDYSYAKSNYGAKNPDEANIAIVCKEGSSTKGGYWYDKKTGKKVEDQYVAHATIYAIRLDNWSLIDSTELSVALSKGSKNVNAESMLNAYDINYLCENGHFNKDNK